MLQVNRRDGERVHCFDLESARLLNDSGFIARATHDMGHVDFETEPALFTAMMTEAIRIEGHEVAMLQVER